MAARSQNDVDLDTIAKDIADLRTDLGELMGNVKKRAAGAVTGESRRLYGSLLAERDRKAAALVRRVEDRPFSSLLIALAAGFVGAQFLRR